MKDKIFVDSNVWLYAFILADPNKHDIAKKLITENTSQIIISSQVVNEISVNLIKKAGVDEDFIRSLVEDAFSKYYIDSLQKEVIVKASIIREKYRFSYWDSLMVASALENNCKILYSEDMQDGQIIEKRLTIINPFKD